MENYRGDKTHLENKVTKSEIKKRKDNWQKHI